MPEGVSNQALPTPAAARSLGFNSIGTLQQQAAPAGAPPPPSPQGPQGGAYKPATSAYSATEEFADAEPTNESAIELPKAIIPDVELKEAGPTNKIILNNVQAKGYEMTSALQSFLQQDKAKAQIASCFSSETPWLQLNFNFTLDEAGKVTNASADSLVGDDLEEEIKSCVLSLMQAWTYPAIGEVSFTLTFLP